MEATPPNYEDAVNRDHWRLVSGSLQTTDLLSAVLVCKAWHRFFAPALWGNPSAHFDEQGDVVEALARFSQCLTQTRLLVRELTHTLRIRGDGHIYNSPSTQWLQDLLSRLPNLQALCIQGFRFFDHASLVGLRKLRVTERWDAPIANLRLLDASYCENATVSGLVEAMQYLRNLIYLDLSGSSAAKNTDVLLGLNNLHDLKVLKVRSIGMRDEDFSVLCVAIGVRVRSLDVSSNFLTDRSLTTVMSCLLAPTEVEPANQSFQDENFEKHLYKMLTAYTLHDFFLENEINVGITHLRIADNKLSRTGIMELLSLPFLHILDVSLCNAITRYPKAKDALTYSTEKSSTLPYSKDRLSRSDLARALVTQSRANLTYLRISYSIALENSPSEAVKEFSALWLDSLLTQPYAQIEDLQMVQEQRRRLCEFIQKKHPAFYPLNFPKLRTLVLTDVATKCTTRRTICGLISLLDECANLADLARLEARLDYTLPPGWGNRKKIIDDRAAKIFPLKRIVLEMSSSTFTKSTMALPPTGNSSWHSSNGSTSLTEDADSQAFWAASTSDFSFFQDVQNIKGSLDMKSDAVPNEKGKKVDIKQGLEPLYTIDTVKELSEFRRVVFEGYQAAKDRGKDFEFPVGLWDGDVKVVYPRSAQLLPD